jgi:hypothetical protein
MDSAKAIGLFRLRVNGVLSVFDIPGLRMHIPPAANALYEAAMNLHNDLKTEPYKSEKLSGGLYGLTNEPKLTVQQTVQPYKGKTDDRKKA